MTPWILQLFIAKPTAGIHLHTYSTAGFVGTTYVVCSDTCHIVFLIVVKVC